MSNRACLFSGGGKTGSWTVKEPAGGNVRKDDDMKEEEQTESPGKRREMKKKEEKGPGYFSGGIPQAGRGFTKTTAVFHASPCLLSGAAFALPRGFQAGRRHGICSSILL